MPQPVIDAAVVKGVVVVVVVGVVAVVVVVVVVVVGLGLKQQTSLARHSLRGSMSPEPKVWMSAGSQR